MDQVKVSRTAVGVAVRRAAHQLYDDSPRVLDDPFAVRILGERFRSLITDSVATLRDERSSKMRSWLVGRHRYAEDQLAAAVERGVTQYVLLGAGMDTFGLRNPHPGLRVFEVDQPGTQGWKRALMAQAGLAEPACVRYVSVDFERQSLREELERAGLDAAAPAVFAWLGVVVYLTRGAFRGTIGFIAGLPEGSGVVFDYTLPRHMVPERELAERDELAARVAELGEPFQGYFTPEEMAAELTGFQRVEDLSAEEMDARYFAGRSDGLGLGGRSGRMLSAWR